MKIKTLPKLSLAVASLLLCPYLSFAQLPPLLQCGGNAPSFSVNCGHATNWAYINGITTTNGINNISNTGTGCGNTSNSYSDYTGTSMKVTQDAGKSVDVTISWSGNNAAPANITSTLTRIYVDWDRNGLFSTNEYIDPGPFAGPHPHSHGATGTITIDVPAYAKDGLTRMRIITSALNSFTYDPNVSACQGVFGEAEDYVFEVINPCVPPNVISISNVDYKSGDFSWTAKANAEFYEYVITPADTIPDDTVIGFTFTTSNSVDVDTFECDKKYYILVRAICDTANKTGAIAWDKSDWIRDSFVTNPCCYTPEVKVDMITHNTARVSWNAIPTAHGYEYAVSTIKTPPQQGSYTINTSVFLQGLNFKTNYYVHVRSRCSPTPLSDWTQEHFKTLQTTGVNEVNNEALQLNVFPNPTRGILNIELSTQPADNAVITIVNLKGEIVYSTQVQSDIVTVDAGSFASGIYILKYKDDVRNSVMKISKQ